MKKRWGRFTAALMAGTMALSMVGCGSSNTASASVETSTESADNSEKVTIKIAWWGGDARHAITQEALDLYTELNPNVTFETSPSGWDGYFESLSTQAASGAMPDIVQMDYLYISTYANNGTLADLTPYIEDGTIDVSNIDENILNSGQIGDEMAGLVLSTSVISASYNPTVLEMAGLEAPEQDWTFDDFAEDLKTIHDETGLYGATFDPVGDTNIFNYWVRSHGESLFSEDQKSLGYDDDQIFVDFVNFFKDLMDEGAFPNPDQLSTLTEAGDTGLPIVTDEAGYQIGWNNFPTNVSEINDSIQLVTPPTTADGNGLWLKPGMFFSISESSEVKDEAAKFLNWFVNSTEAADVVGTDRGTPVSSEIREYLRSNGSLSEKQVEMFDYVDIAAEIAGETPAPDPAGISEINTALKEAATSVFYGAATAEEAAATFRTTVNDILTRNN